MTEGSVATGDALDTAYSALSAILDREEHDDDCVWRCLRVNCNLDHGCSKCWDGDERDPIEVYGTPEHEAWLIEREREEG